MLITQTLTPVVRRLVLVSLHLLAWLLSLLGSLQFTILHCTLADMRRRTETDGSITCPANQNNVVGIKTTVGLTSRAGGKSCLATSPVRFTNLPLVIPISEHQDTVGPLARSVTDAAIVLSIIAGPDPNDNFTLAQPMPVPDYTMALSNTSLVGKRIGVPRAVFLNDSMTGNDPYVNQVFEQALETLKTLGATIVDPADLPSAYEIYESNNETIVLDVDFKVFDHI